MAKLINRKTGKEVDASDPEAVVKRFPKSFTVKPATKLNSDVAKKENALLSKNLGDIEKDLSKLTDVKDLEKLLKEEKEGKARSGAITHIEDRIASLKNNPNTNQE